MVKKLVYFVLLTMVSNFVFADAQWSRAGNIFEKELPGNGDGIIKVFGKLRPATGFDPKFGCSIGEFTGGDDVLEFDVSQIAEKAGSLFDVNKIYVDGFGAGGDYALDIWLENWKNKTGFRSLPWLFDGNNWGSHNIISICVGAKVQTLTLDSQLQAIVLWYDGPVNTTQQQYPKEEPHGDSMDISKTEDALAVANNGVTVAHLNGSGISTHETEAPTLGKPDFIVNSVHLTTTSGTEQYAYNIGDQMQMKAELKNTGDASIPHDKYVYTRFYLSNGYKEDSHNQWVRVGTDQTLGSHLDPSETHNEEEGLKLWEYPQIQPGKVYNIVVCTDRTADQNNGSGDWIEKHESNNCSTEAVFTVNGSFNFTLPSLVLGGGKTNLKVGEPFSVDMIAYNAGSNSPKELRVGYYLSGGTLPNEVLLGTKIITESEFVSGASKPLSLDGLIAPTDAGAYTLEACVDYDERVQETVENDNCYSIMFNVTTPVIANPAPKKTSPAIFTILFGI